MGIKRILVAMFFIGIFTAPVDAQFNRHRRRGTIIGGVAGAAIGAAIADRRDNEAVGALIGGTTGAIIGRSIGAQKDHRIEHQIHNQYQDHRHYVHPRPVYPQPVPVVVPIAPVVRPSVPPIIDGPQPISQTDVIAMVRNGLSDKLIASQIQNHGISHQVGVSDVIFLHQNGVSEWLIQWMQHSVVSNAPEFSHLPQNYVQQRSHATYHAPATQQATPQHVLRENSTPQQSDSRYGESIIGPEAPDGVLLNPAN